MKNKPLLQSPLRSIRRLPLLLCLLLGGCLGINTTTNPVRLLILPTPDVPEITTAGQEGISVLFREIGIPGYLRRSDIVTRNPDGSLSPIARYRWAEPLEDGILRVLVSESVGLPGVRSVRTEFQSGDIHSDYTLSILIIDLLAHHDGRITIAGNLSITARDSAQTWDTMLRFELTDAWTPTNPGSIAEGYANAIREFAARTLEQIGRIPSS